MTLKSVVLCKWQPKLAKELIGRARTHVVLDDFDANHANIDPEVLAGAASVHRVSTFTALEELATVAVSIRLLDPDVARVVSYTEFSQLGAAYLAEVMGLGCTVPASIATRDKRMMKMLVAGSTVAVPSFATLSDPSDEDAVARLAAELQFPVVVKPAAGFGTMSTYRAADADEFRAVCRSFRYEPLLSSRELTVESFIDGEELHVDAYWGKSEPRFLLVSRYFAPRLAVQRGECPQDGGEFLPRERHQQLYADIEPLVAEVMDRLGVTETMIHLEVFRQDDGRLVFSEIASRVGGGWIPGLTSQTMGRSIWPVIADLVVDGRTDPPRPVAPYIGVLHLQPGAPGRIVEIPTVAQILAVPGVLEAQVFRKAGSVLKMNHPSEWVAFAFIGAPTADEFDLLVREIPGLLPVRTVPVEAE